jgi:hypothetical protein
MDVEGDVSMDDEEDNPWGGFGEVPQNPATSTAPVAPGTLGSTKSASDAQGAVDAPGATASGPPVVRTPGRSGPTPGAMIPPTAAEVPTARGAPQRGDIASDRVLQEVEGPGAVEETTPNPTVPDAASTPPGNLDPNANFRGWADEIQTQNAGPSLAESAALRSVQNRRGGFEGRGEGQFRKGVGKPHCWIEVQRAKEIRRAAELEALRATASTSSCVPVGASQTDSFT